MSPRSNIGGERIRVAHLAAIAAEAGAFLTSLHDPEARGARITLADGSTVPRLPGYTRWIDAEGFAGFANLRWQPGTDELPAHVSGHVGYGVVPHRRGEGIATRALALLLDEARGPGLGAVTLTTEVEDIASQRAIAANGGVMLGGVAEPPALGGREIVRWRIGL